MLDRFNHLRVQRVTVAVISFLLLAAPAFGQDSFVAIPPAEAAQYKIDFARNFFVSPEAEKADRAKLYATVAQLEMAFLDRVSTGTGSDLVSHRSEESLGNIAC